MFVDNSGTLINGTHTLTFDAIAEVDRSGVKLIRPKKKSGVCPRSPARMAVDSKRIDGLRPPDQIKALSGGSFFVREQGGTWPTCGIAAHGTMLTGFQEALAAMLDEWRRNNGGS